MKTRFVALGLAGIIVVLDQITKFLVSQSRPYFHVIPGFFSINYVENTGAAFGILQGQQLFLILVSLAAIVILTFFIFYEPEGHPALVSAFGLILGGTIGNLLDRVRFGYVVDFLHFYIKQYFDWPSFNIADSAITVGVTVLIIATLFESHRHNKPSSGHENVG